MYSSSNSIISEPDICCAFSVDKSSAYAEDVIKIIDRIIMQISLRMKKRLYDFFGVF